MYSNIKVSLFVKQFTLAIVLAYLQLSVLCVIAIGERQERMDILLTGPLHVHACIGGV